MAMDVNTNRLGPLTGRTDLPEANVSKEALGQPGEFGALLKDKVLAAPSPASAGESISQAQPLKFSSHALARIRDRGITMGKEQMAKLEKAVDTAAAKGSKDSLILSSDAAFIVSVKNRTVITVMDRTAMTGNVFTNIDSTVVM